MKTLSHILSAALILTAILKTSSSIALEDSRASRITFDQFSQAEDQLNHEPSPGISPEVGLAVDDVKDEQRKLVRNRRSSSDCQQDDDIGIDDDLLSEDEGVDGTGSIGTVDDSEVEHTIRGTADLDQLDDTGSSSSGSGPKEDDGQTSDKSGGGGSSPPESSDGKDKVDGDSGEAARQDDEGASRSEQDDQGTVDRADKGDKGSDGDGTAAGDTESGGAPTGDAAADGSEPASDMSSSDDPSAQNSLNSADPSYEPTLFLCVKQLDPKSILSGKSQYVTKCYQSKDLVLPLLPSFMSKVPLPRLFRIVPSVRNPGQQQQQQQSYMPKMPNLSSILGKGANFDILKAFKRKAPETGASSTLQQQQQQQQEGAPAPNQGTSIFWSWGPGNEQ